ncbi:MAG: YezD family protein [Roseburia sp.]
MSAESNAAKEGETYIDEVKRLIKDIKYGSLTLVIQDGKVIQIDKAEKFRLRN